MAGRDALPTKKCTGTEAGATKAETVAENTTPYLRNAGAGRVLYLPYGPRPGRARKTGIPRQEPGNEIKVTVPRVRGIRGLFSTDAVRFAHHILREYATVFD
jgi:hypothetical protein